MSRHVDANGNEWIEYSQSGVKDCNCIRCRGERTLLSEADGDGEALLLKFAAQIAKKKRIPLTAAMAEARKQFPAVAQAAERRYAQDDNNDAVVDGETAQAGLQLHALAVDHMRATGEKKYSRALTEVCHENPTLAATYTGVARKRK